MLPESRKEIEVDFAKMERAEKEPGDACKCGSIFFWAGSSHYHLLAPVYIKQPPSLFWATALIK